MKRLLVLTSTYPRGKCDCIPAFVHELSSHLTKYFQVAVLCPHSDGAATSENMDGVLVFRYRYAPVKMETLAGNGGISQSLRKKPWKALLIPSFILCQAIALKRLIREFAPDVIHSHWIIPQGIIVAALSTLIEEFPPFMVTVHGTDLKGCRGVLFKQMKKLAAKRAAAFTVVNSSMIDEVSVLGCSCPISVKPMGTELKELFTITGNMERGKNSILYVGRLSRSKGIFTLLNAFLSVLERYPDSVLSIAGNGSGTEEVRNEIVRLGIEKNVKLLGPINHGNLPELYRQAALFVAPFSYDEGFGLVVVEAIGCGCRVVATDTPAVRSISSGINTVTLVPKPDSVSLAMTINKVLGSTSTSIDDLLDSSESVRKRFDWSVVAEGYANELERISNL